MVIGRAFVYYLSGVDFNSRSCKYHDMESSKLFRTLFCSRLRNWYCRMIFRNNTVGVKGKMVDCSGLGLGHIAPTHIPIPLSRVPSFHVFIALRQSKLQFVFTAILFVLAYHGLKLTLPWSDHLVKGFCCRREVIGIIMALLMKINVHVRQPFIVNLDACP